MTTDPKTLIERFPLTAEACNLNDDQQWPRWQVARRIRNYAEDNSIGDCDFDSIESLMQAIESHLAASRPKPLTEEDVNRMRWTYVPFEKDLYAGSATDSNKLFAAFDRIHRDAAIAAHNEAIDRLWAECKRLTAELEAKR